MSEEKIVLSVANIKKDLANGVTRLKTDKHYHADKGSIEEKYGLTPSEVRQLFKEPLLQGVRLVPYVEKRWTLIPDEKDVITENSEQVMSENTDEEQVSTNITEEDELTSSESINSEEESNLF